MKNKELYDFRDGLDLATFEHPRNTYAINKNKRLLKQEIKDMEKAVEPSESAKEFIEKREELAKKYSVKDKNGNPKTKPLLLPGGKSRNVYVINGEDDAKSEYSIKLKDIEEKYKESIIEHEEKVKKYNEEFLEDESSFEPFMITMDMLEHEKCPQHVMDKIFYMIKE